MRRRHRRWITGNEWTDFEAREIPDFTCKKVSQTYHWFAGIVLLRLSDLSPTKLGGCSSLRIYHFKEESAFPTKPFFIAAIYLGYQWMLVPFLLVVCFVFFCVDLWWIQRVLFSTRLPALRSQHRSTKLRGHLATLSNNWCGSPPIGSGFPTGIELVCRGGTCREDRRRRGEYVRWENHCNHDGRKWTPCSHVVSFVDSTSTG